ncbi:MAG: hypothetical protein PV358_03710 [Acidimicrobiales bacterium]|nr:hypothetical protein [Acidimicrobiales bacterium]
MTRRVAGPAQRVVASAVAGLRERTPDAGDLPEPLPGESPSSALFTEHWVRAGEGRPAGHPRRHPGWSG